MSNFVNLGYVFIISSIVLSIIGAINFKTLKRSTPLRVLYYLVVISLLFDIVGAFMQTQGIHNIWLYNLYNLVDYSLFAIFYLSAFNLKRNWNLIVSSVYATVLGIMLISTIALSFTENLNSTLMGIRSIMMICSSAFYFKIMLDEIKFDTPWSNPLFWVNSAVLIYFSGCFFIFIFSEYRDSTRVNLWHIHSIIHIVYNLLILVGFWKARKA